MTTGCHEVAYRCGMGPDDYVIALYAVSGTLALGCAFLPGAGPVGRCANILTSMLLLLWTANIYLRNGWYCAHPAMLLIPATMVGYAMVTMQRQHRKEQAEWFSPAYQVDEQTYRFADADRRSPGRRPLPGEYDSTPVNEAPPPHDPWAALYASAERELMRGGVGRHRPNSQLAQSGRYRPGLQPTVAASTSTSTPAPARVNTKVDTLTSLTACQDALAATEAAYELWQHNGPVEPNPL
jgi:hypothetical protein